MGVPDCEREVAGNWEDGTREKTVLGDADELPESFISGEGRTSVVLGKDCEGEVEGVREEGVGEIGSLLGRKGSQSCRF